ncbi:class I SAM-dependent methyltransferase [Aliarcobacter cryaerophilus]|uniref:Class I SAM-dependent methyltransferase n=1 Tax=Aliarcobacter cryaerophilus TaxID=28198 RepID=A0A2S9TPV6_9BACT|nr:class I SAM-dependent methyltransferase [Aliarcobacter cryaerophilus]PRN00877.1 hypothetical protein CJ668_04590 [Arcobacter cryaerophilus gv. pseudocryaerophilus]
MKINNILRKCPNCNTNEPKLIFSKHLENFDGFNLLCEYKVVQCKNCNFIYNNNVNDELLNEFYIKESLYSSESSYGTGGNNSGDINRYNTYLEILKKYLSSSSVLCDVGCGKGGFIQFLQEKNYQNSLGLELDQRLINLSTSDKILKTELYNYPLKNKEVDCFTFTHVFEHILNLNQVIAEIHRSLKDDGFLFIEVPDAENYLKHNVFDFYWFTIKEHINHFTLSSLCMLMKNNGFELIEKEQSGIKYNNKKYSYPSLRCIFKKNSNKHFSYHLDNFSFNNYIEQEEFRMNLHKKKILEIINKYKKIYFWGIGQEFFTLISNMNINFDNYNISLVDINKDKQKLTVNGLKIEDPSNITTTNPEETCIIICSVFNNETIKNSILKINKDLNYYEL